MPWNKNAIISTDNGLEYQIFKYTCNHSATSITEISINGYRGRHYQISVKAASSSNHNTLKNTLQNKGFLLANSDHDQVIVSSSDPIVLCYFLFILQQIEHSLNEVIPILSHDMRLPACRQPFSMPEWNRIGLFTQTIAPHNPASPFSINRRVLYQSMKGQQAFISEFLLYSMTNGLYKFEFKLNTPNNAFLSSLFTANHSEMTEKAIALQNAFQQNDLPVQRNNLSNSFHLLFSTDRIKEFERLLTLIGRFSPQFKAVIPSFIQHIKPILRASHQQRLEELGFNEKELSLADKALYDTYCCALSYDLMTYPVFDPRTPHYHFERSWIIEALKRKPMHPYTRQPLTVEQLQLNSTLKKAIDDFVEQLISSYGLSQNEHYVTEQRTPTI